MEPEAKKPETDKPKVEIVGEAGQTSELPKEQASNSEEKPAEPTQEKPVSEKPAEPVIQIREATSETPKRPKPAEPTYAHVANTKPKRRIKWGSIIAVAVILLLLVIYFVPFTENGSLFSQTVGGASGAAVTETMEEEAMEQTDPNEVKAIINQEIEILQSDIDEAYENLPPNVAGLMDEESLLRDVIIPARLIKNLAEAEGIDTAELNVNEMLNKLLLARAADIDVKASEVTKSVNRAKQQIAASSDLTYEEFLVSQGITEEEFKQSLEDRLRIAQFFEIEITNEQVQSFYEENKDFLDIPEQRKASHILICYQGAQNCDAAFTQEEALAKAQSIKAILDDGADFAELAQQESTGPSSVNGGDLGYFTADRMVQPFSEAAFNLKQGQISGPVETQFGYHIIQVVDIIEEKEATLANTRDEIKELLTNQEIGAKTQAFVEALVASADVQIL